MSQGYPPPDYILANWTDELLMLMIEKHEDRAIEDSEAARSGNASQDVTVDEDTLIAMAGGKIKKVTVGG